MNNKESSNSTIGFATKVLVVGIGGEYDRTALYKVDAPIKDDGRVQLVRRGERGGSITVHRDTLLKGRKGSLRFYVFDRE